MILSDKTITNEVENGNITISDFDKTRINPASYDVLLGDEIAMYLPKMDSLELLTDLYSGAIYFRDLDPANKGLPPANNRQEFLKAILYETTSFSELVTKLNRMLSFKSFYQFIHDIQQYIVIDPLNKPEVFKFKIPEEGFTIRPNYFYLYTTKEVIGSKIYASEIKNKSSLARLGILPHMVSSWIDPGFVGNITLEVACWIPVILRSNMKIGQLIFHEVTEVEQTYDQKPGSKYMNQKGVTESKYHENYKPQANV